MIEPLPCFSIAGIWCLAARKALVRLTLRVPFQPSSEMPVVGPCSPGMPALLKTGIANFANGIQCAKNFSNAMDSKLTTGGPYVTDETVTSFKGYYRDSAGQYVAFTRSFVQFDGEGDTANARPRAIGGHPALVWRGMCLRKDPDSPYANQDGYVPFGKLVDYAGGRSNGCTSWSRSD